MLTSINMNINITLYFKAEHEFLNNIFFEEVGFKLKIINIPENTMFLLKKLTASLLNLIFFNIIMSCLALNRRPYGKLGVREKPFYRVCHYMRTTVP